MSRLNFCPLEPFSPSRTITADLLCFLADIINPSLTSGCKPSVFDLEPLLDLQNLLLTHLTSITDDCQAFLCHSFIIAACSLINPETQLVFNELVVSPMKNDNIK